ncbi:MAG: 50S ribosomal protein L19 [Anaerolineales bacterium]|nr:MAG: 50S ribosomal protein L19 [Anaerolineales bacterium]
MSLLESLNSQLEPNPNIAALKPGDTVKVHARIVEGDRERVQVFQGTVVRMRGGGPAASFTVRRIASHGVGVERTFLLHSPRIDKVEVTRRAHTRRAQLYFLRQRRGKAARLKEKRRR